MAGGARRRRPGSPGEASSPPSREEHHEDEETGAAACASGPRRARRDGALWRRLGGRPPLCGLGNGQKATGEPILVGSVVGETGPDDFSAGADAARAYFNCVNENGGINGRPIEFLVEDDQWKPEVAAQVASKLVKDKGVVALVGNGSFVEMTVNAKLYEDENVAVVASACAVRECFEAKNIASTNQGPVPSNISAVQWAVENLGSKKVACVGLNIPSNGVVVVQHHQ